MARVGILGAGSWGIALSTVLHKNGHDVTVWSILEDEVQLLRKNREHKEKLPGVMIPEEIVFTSDLKETVPGRDVLIMAVPSPYVRSTAHLIASMVTNGQIIVNVAKGIEDNTLYTLTQIIHEEIPNASLIVNM